jgi:5-methylcytosine-specific restriction endonuclease McrA
LIPRTEIRSALRKLWLWSPQRRAALKRAKWNGTKLYRCEGCHRATDKPEVDHKIPVGVTPGSRLDMDGQATWDSLIHRLFTGEDGLEILCRSCHEKKTNAHRANKGAAS